MHLVRGKEAALVIYTYTMIDHHGVRHIAVKHLFYDAAPPASACGAQLFTDAKDLLVQPVTCIQCLSIQQNRK